MGVGGCWFVRGGRSWIGRLGAVRDRWWGCVGGGRGVSWGRRRVGGLWSRVVGRFGRGVWWFRRRIGWFRRGIGRFGCRVGWFWRGIGWFGCWVGRFGWCVRRFGWWICWFWRCVCWRSTIVWPICCERSFFRRSLWWAVCRGGGIGFLLWGLLRLHSLLWGRIRSTVRSSWKPFKKVIRISVGEKKWNHLAFRRIFTRRGTRIRCFWLPPPPPYKSMNFFDTPPPYRSTKFLKLNQLVTSSYDITYLFT